MKRVRIPLVVPSVFILAVCAGCAAEGDEPPPVGGPPPGGAASVPVATATVVQKPMPVEIRVIGSAEAYSTVAIRSQTTGQLIKVNFREGDEVQEGQVLFELDRRPLEAAVAQAQANLARDMAQAANAEVQAKRLQELVTRGIAPREQADTARTSVTALNATVEAERAALASAKVALQYATITAPFSGRTGALMVHQGNLVRANDATPLVTINQFTMQDTDTTELYRWAPVLESRIRELPGFVDVTSDLQTNTPMVTVEMDRDKLSTLGLTATQVESALYNAYGTRQVSQIFAPSNQYQVILRVAPEFQSDPAAMSLLHVRSSSGRLIPLESVARLKTAVGPFQVNHFGQLPSVTISFNLAPGLALGDAVQRIQATAAETLPALNLYAFVGVIMLVGLVKKNGIMMVDFAVDAQRQGKTPAEAFTKRVWSGSVRS